MQLPVAEMLKLVLNGVRKRSPAAMRDGRLDTLFAMLQEPASDLPAEEIEDEIWAIWTGHDDPALEARMQRAISAIARRRYAEAETLLDALTGEAPGWAEAWNKRATLYYLTRRDAESLDDIRRALQLEPRHFGAICGFGQICLRHGEKAAAASAFAAALQLNPHLESVRAVLSELEPAPPPRLN
ncbi:MAG TPA: tetratricopeptide repeat protein [Ferrovibrio sp.]|uniref:tetratricopeptide repeat protein n=1 Tax=Ferrovibrio sp. TaxID=1917215 RepID=UPI002ED42028